MLLPLAIARPVRVCAIGNRHSKLVCLPRASSAAVLGLVVKLLTVSGSIYIEGCCAVVSLLCGAAVGLAFAVWPEQTGVPELGLLFERTIVLRGALSVLLRAPWT